MKKLFGFLLVFLGFVLVDCTSSAQISSCKRKCSDKTGLCVIALNTNGTISTNNLLICQLYSIDCDSNCGGGGSGSSSKSSSSGSRSSSSSSGGSRSSGGSSGGGSSSSGGSSGGSGGSSHEIFADF